MTRTARKPKNIDIVVCEGFHAAKNPKAKLLIVGLTPGRQQLELARKAIAEGVTPEEFQRRVAFAGSMRTNLVSMLDQLGVGDALGVKSTAELFGTPLLETTSAVRDPVFVNGNNWSGSNPGILDSPQTRAYVETHLREIMLSLPHALVVPQGKAVDLALRHLGQEINPSRVMFGFPHASPANGHQRKQFEANRAELVNVLRSWSKRDD